MARTRFSRVVVEKAYLRGMRTLLRRAESDAEPPGVFRDMYEVREFRLVLCADVLDYMVGRAMRQSERVVGVERENGRLDYLACGPLIKGASRSRL